MHKYHCIIIYMHESKPPIKKTYGGGATTSKVSVVIP